MELKLKIYDDRLCRKNEREVTAPDFGLSVQVCEEVLQVINIDAFADGVDTMSNESLYSVVFSVVKNGLPYFTELIKEIFDVSGDIYFYVGDAAKVLFEIVKYSINELKPLATSIKGKNSKN